MSRYPWKSLALAGAVAVLGGCLKSSSQKLAVVSMDLVLSGTLVAPDGRPVSGAEVRVERDPQALATTDAVGQFQVNLSKTYLSGISSQLDPAQVAFHLYFRKTSASLYGASSGIAFSELGVRPLGNISLAGPAAYSGKVLRADLGQLAGPAAGAQLYLGPERVIAAADGTFTVTKAPQGLIPFTVVAPGMQSAYEDVQLTSGQTLARPSPVVLFPGNGPDGLMMEKPGKSLGELIASGHPTAKHFHVIGAVGTAYVRYYHDLNILESLIAQEGDPTAGVQTVGTPAPKTTSGTATARSSSTQTTRNPVNPSLPSAGSADVPWHPIEDLQADIDYDFPDSGGQIIYYQFTDFTKSLRSKVYQLGVNVDLFADTDGFAIGDGSGLSTQSRVSLNIHVPRAAVGMRFAEDQRDFQTLPWQAVRPQVPFSFHPLSADQATIAIGGAPVRRMVYGQFQDAFGHESKVFTAIVDLNLFPGADMMIADGSGFATSQVVPLNLKLPPGINFVRATEIETDLAKAPWQPAAPLMPFKFDPIEDLLTLLYSVSGNRSVCVQMQDPNGFISSAICRQVLIDLFRAPGVGFTINGGAPISTSRQVTLSITPPPNATQMRIYENGPDNSSSSSSGNNVIIIPANQSTSQLSERAWMAVAPTAVYTFALSGAKTLFVQFRDAGNLVSAHYQQAITILPLAESYSGTGIEVNGGAPIAIGSMLNVAFINIPQTAIAVAVSVDFPLDALSANTWQPLSPAIQVPVFVAGMKTVYVLFRNSDLGISPVFKVNIFYDPFPPDTVLIQLNDGNATTSVTNVNAAIAAPGTAYNMRVSHDMNALATLPYAPFTAAFADTLPSLNGTYRLYAQFRAPNGDQSIVFSSNPVTLTLPSTATATGTATGTATATATGTGTATATVTSTATGTGTATATGP